MHRWLYLRKSCKFKNKFSWVLFWLGSTIFCNPNGKLQGKRRIFRTPHIEVLIKACMLPGDDEVPALYDRNISLVIFMGSKCNHFQKSSPDHMKSMFAWGFPPDSHAYKLMIQVLIKACMLPGDDKVHALYDRNISLVIFMGSKCNHFKKSSPDHMKSMFALDLFFCNRHHIIVINQMNS